MEPSNLYSNFLTELTTISNKGYINDKWIKENINKNKINENHIECIIQILYNHKDNIDNESYRYILSEVAEKILNRTAEGEMNLHERIIKMNDEEKFLNLSKMNLNFYDNITIIKICNSFENSKYKLKFLYCLNKINFDNIQIKELLNNFKEIEEKKIYLKIVSIKSLNSQDIIKSLSVENNGEYFYLMYNIVINAVINKSKYQQEIHNYLI